MKMFIPRLIVFCCYWSVHWRFVSVLYLTVIIYLLFRSFIELVKLSAFLFPMIPACALTLWISVFASLVLIFLWICIIVKRFVACAILFLMDVLFEIA